MRVILMKPENKQGHMETIEHWEDQPDWNHDWNWIKLNRFSVLPRALVNYLEYKFR